MKKNNKGFMLGEVIITATVIISTMVGLYASFQKIYANYNMKSNYCSLDGAYATKEMINHFLYSGTMLKTNPNKFISDTFQNQHFTFFIKDSQCQESDIFNDDTCSNIQSTYQVTNMILLEYDKTTLDNEVKQEPINQTFKDYIDYVIGYYDITSTNTKYSYLILTEINADGNYYYSNLRLR